MRQEAPGFDGLLTRRSVVSRAGKLGRPAGWPRWSPRPRAAVLEGRGVRGQGLRTGGWRDAFASCRSHLSLASQPAEAATGSHTLALEKA